MKYVSTTCAPRALGHYTQAVVSRGIAYISGQLPLNPDDLSAPLGDIKSQTLQTLKNIEAILRAVGSSKSNVIKTTLYITNLEEWYQINTVYAEFFGDATPARSAVPVTGLPKNCRIEIDVIAEVPEVGNQ